MNRNVNLPMSLCLWMAILAVAAPASAQAPSAWIYSGVLYDDAGPYSGEVELVVELYPEAEGGAMLWSEAHDAVMIDRGRFSVLLGESATLAERPLSGELVWLEVTVQGHALEPRIPLGSVPYAQRADVAERSLNSEGVYVGDTRVVDATGAWQGTRIAAHNLELDALQDQIDALLISLAGLDTRLDVLENRVLPPDLSSEVATLNEAVDSLEDVLYRDDGVTERLLTVEASTERLANLTEPMRRSGTNIYFEGVNIHVRSGGGSTYHSTDLAIPGDPNGLGNLIIGYDEADAREGEATQGSHNLVVGPGHTYTSFGAAIFGRGNSASGPSSLVAGYRNVSEALRGALLGGLSNTVSGTDGVVVGGDRNVAGSKAVVLGGGSNTASAVYSVVLGGNANAADASASVVLGGMNNVASGVQSIAIAGIRNSASGYGAAVMAGHDNTAAGGYSAVFGGESNQASSTWQVVVGE